MTSFFRQSAALLRGVGVVGCLSGLGGCTPRVLPAGHTLTDTKQRPDPGETQPRGAPEPGQAAVPPGPPPEAPSAPLYAEVPPDGTSIGDDGGIALEAISATGHWVAFCSASMSGTDVLTDARGAPRTPIRLTLQVGDEQEPIEAVLRAHPGGRYLVVEKDAKPWLIDAYRKERWDLSTVGADLRRDANPDHRSFSFSESALLFLREDEGAGLIPLPTDDVKSPNASLPQVFSLDWGPRSAFRLETRGNHVFASTLPVDSTPQAWPVRQVDDPVHRCAAPHRPFPAFTKASSYFPSPDIEIVWRYLSGLTQGEGARLSLEPAPGFVMPHRKGWVRRQESGRLLLVEGATQKQIASERCGARILHADDASGNFLISCEHYAPVYKKPSPPGGKKKSPPQYRFEVYLVRPGYVKSLKVDMARTGVDVRGAQGTRYVALRPGSSAALVDLSTSQLFALDEGTVVINTGKDGALLRRGSRLSYWTPTAESPLPQILDAWSSMLTEDTIAVLDRTFYRLGQGLQQQELRHIPLFVAPSGHTLTPREAGSLSRWPRGPLLLLPPPDADSDRNDEPVVVSTRPARPIPPRDLP